MRAKATYKVKNGRVQWTLRAIDDRLMTPDRLVDSGDAKTHIQATAQANCAWEKFIRSL